MMSTVENDPAPTWFNVATAVGDRLVPERADWVLLHIRTKVLDLVRSGRSGPLREAGLCDPTPGEPLSIVTLRHRDSDLEVALHQLILAMRPEVGDPYGSGRVTLTGLSRLASQVDPAHLRAIATDEDNLAHLQRLDLGSAVIVPIIADGVTLGALNLVHSDRGAVGDDELATAEALGRRIGAALDCSRPATARLPGPRVSTSGRSWRPPVEGNPVAAARAWVRRTLPEVLHRPVRSDLAEDLDLVVSELAGNALRHAGAVAQLKLDLQPGAIRVTVVDDDERTPVVRHPVSDAESGRGILLVSALSSAWSTDHDVRHGGKQVWAELAL
jgi:anti-sigma regulatory factor (Ser/Thr protein kinase)